MVKELVNDHRKIPVIDIFAGPGGLGEGFSAFHVDRKTPFSVALSIEKDRDAHATLVLRNFYRQFTVVGAPEAYYEHLRGELDREELYRQFPAEAKQAMREAWRVELGAKATARKRVQGRIRDALQRAIAWVLVGGPPCQAYSTAGRSRNRGVKGYRLEGVGGFGQKKLSGE